MKTKIRTNPTNSYDTTHSEELKYVYFRVAKAGTRTILHFLREHDVYVQGAHITPDAYDNPYHQKWDKYFKFSFVRNPWDRMLSCFRDKTKRVLGTPYEIKLYSQFKNCSFVEFVEEVAKQGLDNFDEHLRPQSSCMPENIDFVGKLETFETDFKHVLQKLNIEPTDWPPKRRNSTPHLHYPECYNNKTVDLVTELYKEDVINVVCSRRSS